MSNDKQAFTVRLSQEDYDVLVAIADAEERTVAAQARLFIREGLKAHQPTKIHGEPRSPGWGS